MYASGSLNSSDVGWNVGATGMPCSTQRSALAASRGYLAEYNAEARQPCLSSLNDAVKACHTFTRCDPGFSNRVLRQMVALLAAQLIPTQQQTAQASSKYRYVCIRGQHITLDSRDPSAVTSIPFAALMHLASTLDWWAAPC